MAVGFVFPGTSTITQSLQHIFCFNNRDVSLLLIMNNSAENKYSHACYCFVNTTSEYLVRVHQFNFINLHLGPQLCVCILSVLVALSFKLHARKYVFCTLNLLSLTTNTFSHDSTI